MGTIVRPIRPGISISQKRFGAATGGTLGCFVEDAQSGATMLLSNMDILQFYQAPTSLPGSLLGSVAEDPTQNEIVQPCGIDIKDLAFDSLAPARAWL